MSDRPIPLLVGFTDPANKQKYFLDSAAIRMVTYKNDNPLETLISTYQMGPQGLMTYPALEGREECVRLINAARQGNPSLPSIATN